MRTNKLWLLGICWYGGIGVILGQPIVTLTKDTLMHRLSAVMEVLEDSKRQWSLSEVRSAPQSRAFRVSGNDNLYHSYSLSDYWLRFRVVGKGIPPTAQWFVHLHNPNIDEIDVYCFSTQHDSLIQHYHTGDIYPFRQRPVHYYHFLFPLPLAKADTLTVYLRLRGNYFKNHNVDLLEQSTVLEYQQTKYTFHIFLNTILFALMMYNLLLYLVIRYIVYVYYVGYLLLILLSFLAMDGLAISFLYPNLPVLNRYVANVSVIYSVICLLWFSYYFLQARKLQGAWVRQLMIGVSVLGHGLVVGLLLTDSRLGDSSLMPFVAYFVMLVLCLVIWLDVVALRRGLRQAIFFTIANVFLFSGTFVSLFRRLGLDIPDIIGENSFHIGTVLESILLSFALADRIKIAETEKQKAQAEALMLMEENTQLIEEQNEILEKRVQERTTELEQQNLMLDKNTQELLKVNATKDKLLAIIGHDLRSPLNSLMGLLNLFKSAHISPDEFVVLSGKLHTSLTHLRFTLDNLLRWANTQMQGIHTKPSIIPLYEIGEESLQLLKPLAAEKHLSLHNHIDKNASAYADTDQIALVFRNLISNAIKFTPEGGSITLESSAAPQASHIQTAVCDTGIGLSSDTIESLYSRHVHLSTQGTKGEKGTGLGILLCMEMIDKNHGSLRVESSLGKGSRFIFTLPNNVPTEA